MTKFIFITGGVVSSIGKGAVTSSLGALLIARGYKVKLRKFDPYLNYDPGTMNPYQHGEVYVTDDGTEADLDLGHYERFTGISCTKDDSITSGKIYTEILETERKGDYAGKTVQVIPHVTNIIKRYIRNGEKENDFIVCEIGGTVGDIEGLPFLEAIRQITTEIDKKNVLFIHLTLVPYIEATGENKTKPTQHSVKELRATGIQADIIICRTQKVMPQREIDKISLFCSVNKEAIIQSPDVDNIYRLPYIFHQKKLDEIVLKKLQIDNPRKLELGLWQKINDKIRTAKTSINIGIVGKYTGSGFKDCYKSLIEAINHASLESEVKPNIISISSDEANIEGLLGKLKEVDGIVVPGGFGKRGVEGKMFVTRHAYENDLPYLGICYGMQIAVIERLRSSKQIANATSGEWQEGQKDEKIVVEMLKKWTKDDNEVQHHKTSHLGGTMRLGSYRTELLENSKIAKIYGNKSIQERHRHRYEIDIQYENDIRKSGLIISGKSPDGKLPEIIEAPNHPWFIGVQYHPELKSTPFRPHPIFVSFIKAIKQRRYPV